jgi:hypothetical protein
MGELDNIGLGQAARLCQMKYDDRLTFLAEGLPIILESSRVFCPASQQLKEMPREADVLKNHAEEEAAKILIIMDIVRCPKKLCASKIGAMVKWFYDHLARLIYANAASWSAMNVTQLREYVDNSRQAHYLEGNCGEYILPNSEIATREGKFYADIEAYEDDKPHWHAPSGYASHSLFGSFMPPALGLAEAFSALGLFSVKGVRLVAETWNELEFKDTQSAADSDRLIKQLIGQINTRNLATDAAEQNDVDRLYHSWQLPMYNLDFSLIEVPFEKLQREREAMFYAEMGISGDDY